METYTVWSHVTGFSLGRMFLRFTHVAWISTSFLFEAQKYSIVWKYHTLFLHSSPMGIWAVSTFWLLWIMLRQTFSTFLCGRAFPVLLGEHLGVEWLGHRVTLCFKLLRKCQFFKVAISVHMPNNRVWVSHPHWHLLLCLFDGRHPVGYELVFYWGFNFYFPDS